MSAELKPLRWGFIGCGNIAKDFAIALSTLPQENHIIQHVAARKEEKASEFAKRFSAVTSSGSYENVAKDPNVDVVYVATLTISHKEHALLALNHGKAVLCEKPCAMNPADVKEIIECAKNNKVFFMEGVWTSCNPLYHDITTRIKAGEFGDLGVLKADFGVGVLNSVERIVTKEMGGSVVLDIGIYTFTAADILFGGSQCEKLHVCGNVNEETGIERSASVTMLYDNNRIAHLLDDGDHDLSNKLTAHFSKGTLEVEFPFWAPTKFTFTFKSGEKLVKEFPLPNAESTFFINSVALRYEADHVRDCLLAGKMESEYFPHSTTLRIADYMYQARKQLNTFY